MSTDDFFGVDDDEDNPLAVGHCPSPPSIPSFDTNKVNDPMSQLEKEYFDNEDIYNEDIYHTDRTFDPPSKICGSAVFSKLRSIGNGNQKKKKKKIKEQQQEGKDDNSSSMMALLRNKMKKSKDNESAIVSNERNEDQQPVVVSQSMTMSSISGPSASISIVPTTVEYDPSMKSPNSGHRLESESGSQPMISLQDFQVLLNEIKVLNETVKENSVFKKSSKASHSELSSNESDDVHKHTRINLNGKKCEEESLDGLVLVDSNDDKENGSTIERLKMERKFYRTEAVTLRSELGGIKEELSELRKFLQQRPSTLDENDSNVGVDKYVIDNPQSVEEKTVQIESQTTFEVVSGSSSPTSGGEKVPSVAKKEMNHFNLNRKVHDGSVYTKNCDLFSSLENEQEESILKDQQQYQNQVKSRRPRPIHVENGTIRPSSEISSAEQTNKDSDDQRCCDSNVKKNHQGMSPTSSSPRKSYYEMIYDAVPKKIEHQCIDVTQSIEINCQQDGNERFRHQVICDAEQLVAANEKVKSYPTGKAKSNPRTFEGRSINPMRRRSGLYPPSPCASKIQDTNSISGRVNNSSTDDGRPSGIAHVAHDWVPPNHETNDTKDNVVNQDNVVKSRQTILPVDDNDSTKKFDFEIARNFYRKYEPLHRMKLVKSTENPSSEPPHAQHNPTREGIHFSTVTYPEKQDYDLKAADRRYRELYRPLPKSGDRSNGDNWQKYDSPSHRLHTQSTDSSSAVLRYQQSVLSSSPQRPPPTPLR